MAEKRKSLAEKTSQNGAPEKEGPRFREHRILPRRQAGSGKAGSGKAGTRKDGAQSPQSREKKDGQNALPQEIGGPGGPEPTRYGDWERKGRCVDF